jgi:hypothetical protein
MALAIKFHSLCWCQIAIKPGLSLWRATLVHLYIDIVSLVANRRNRLQLIRAALKLAAKPLILMVLQERYANHLQRNPLED